MARYEEKREDKKMARRERTSKHECLGTLELGIPSYDEGEPWDEPLTPLKNRFSAIHDVQMDEVLRSGAKTSAMENRARYMKPKYQSEREY